MKFIKQYSLFIAAILLITACNNATDPSANQLDVSKIDTTRIALFVTDKDGYMIPVAYKHSPLTEKDFLLIEKLLSDAIQTHNEGYGYPVSLTDHKRQYTYSLNESGERMVEVNCFCKDQPYWREIRMFNFDEYGCNFNTSINLSQKKFEALSVHGKR